MRSIGGIVGLVVIALIAGLTYKYYFAQGQSAGVTTPRQTIDVVGVKNDLVAIGQAERLYQAEHGSYASLDDLVSSGAMSMKKTGRDGYTYEAETSADGFRITANCASDTAPGCTSYAIDQTMEVQTAP
ncbi:MAG TPA: hypothetical protein VN788_13715 [Verrucomicrobiae bacterium]|nr:hypothetical protein [Verrucomicrobiae bacterium]